MSTAELHLRTLFDLDERGRILGTLEPNPKRGALFSLVRSASQCVWAVRSDVPDAVAAELARHAREELPSASSEAPPRHASRYLSLLEQHLGGIELRIYAGPAFTFPESETLPGTLPAGNGVALIDDERLLTQSFQGWVPGEIAKGRAPVAAIVEAGKAVSICFCARRSSIAAEAGLETVEAFRGCGFGPRVTAAWARAVRASGRIPLYSTAWNNTASRAVARKLGLIAYANGWNVEQ